MVGVKGGQAAESVVPIWSRPWATSVASEMTTRLGMGGVRTRRDRLFGGRGQFVEPVLPARMRPSYWLTMTPATRRLGLQYCGRCRSCRAAAQGRGTPQFRSGDDDDSSGQTVDGQLVQRRCAVDQDQVIVLGALGRGFPAAALAADAPAMTTSRPESTGFSRTSCYTDTPLADDHDGDRRTPDRRAADRGTAGADVGRNESSRKSVQCPLARATAPPRR